MTIPANPNDFTLHFVGIGPRKTASTWLYRVLKDHPEICLPTATKELQFFDKYYDRGIANYSKYYSHYNANQLRGDITPGYFEAVEVPERIASNFPDTKLIVSFRNPIARAESHFRHHLRKGRVTSNFSEAIQQLPEITESGKYSKYLPNWLRFFSHDQFKFLLMDDIARQPEIVLKDLLIFLEISANYQPADLYKKSNTTGSPRFPWLAKQAANVVSILKSYQLHHMVNVGKSIGFDKVYTGGKSLATLTLEEKDQLKEYYEEDISYVENLLERSLPKWRNYYIDEKKD